MAVVGGQEYQFYRKYLFQIMQLYRNRADVRAFLEILLSLFTVAIFGVFAIKPTVVTIGGLITEIRSKTQISQQLDQKIQALAAAQQIYEQEKAKIALLETAIPTSPALEDYVKQAELLAIDHQVSIEIVSVKNVPLIGEAVLSETTVVPESEEDTVEPFPPNGQAIEATLAVSGAYQDLLAYLKDIEEARRASLMDSVSFNSVATTADEVLIMTMQKRFAYLPEKPIDTQ